MRRSVLVALPVLALLCSVTGCTSDASDDALVVVATTSIVGEIARAGVGANATVTVVVPATEDPITFAGDDVTEDLLEEADLVVAVARDYEQGLAPSLDAAAARDVPILYLLDDLAPVPYGESLAYALGPPPEGPSAPAVGAPDPAFWLDIDRVNQAVASVADALAGTDAPPATVATDETYQQSLTEADEQVQALLLPLEEEARVVVTDDPRLGYFADRYGLSIRAPGPDRPVTLPPIATDRLGPAGSATDSIPGLVVAVAEAVAGSPP